MGFALVEGFSARFAQCVARLALTHPKTYRYSPVACGKLEHMEPPTIDLPKLLLDEIYRMTRRRTWHGRVGKWRWWFGFQLLGDSDA